MSECRTIQEMSARSHDEVLSPRERTEWHGHLAECSLCRSHRVELEKTVDMVSGLGRISPPADLSLRIRVAVSQQKTKSFDHRWNALQEQVRYVSKALMFPATGGFVSATIAFVLLLSAMGTIQVEAQGPDIPNMLYSPPKLSNNSAPGGIIPMRVDSPVMIEAVVDSKGRLADYRILAGPDTAETRRQLNRSLLFTTFEPARSFGTPTQGRVVVTFSNVDVKG